MLELQRNCRGNGLCELSMTLRLNAATKSEGRRKIVLKEGRTFHRNTLSARCFHENVEKLVLAVAIRFSFQLFRFSSMNRELKMLERLEAPDGTTEIRFKAM